jgi:hypothetical protein
MYKRIVEGKCTQTVCTCRPGPCLNPSPVSTTAQCGAGEKVTGSWSNDAELIALCMDMLGDIPGETLDVRIERLVGAHLEALSTPPAPVRAAQENALRRSFRHVDQEDWDRLFGIIGPNSPKGSSFWYAVLNEAHAALAAPQDNPQQKGEG